MLAQQAPAGNGHQAKQIELRENEPARARLITERKEESDEGGPGRDGVLANMHVILAQSESGARRRH